MLIPRCPFGQAGGFPVASLGIPLLLPFTAWMLSTIAFQTGSQLDWRRNKFNARLLESPPK